MGLTQYILPINYRVVYAGVCQITRLLALTMLVPALVAMVFGEFGQAVIFTLIAAGAFGIGLTGRVAGQPDLSGKEALVVVAMSYLIYGIMGAFAFLTHTPYLNGFFESMSAISTTGLTVLSAEHIPNSLLFFRSFSQWLGGAGIIILSLRILVGPSRNAFRLYATEFGEEKLAGSVRATAGLVLKVYSILTVAGFIVYLAVGFPVFDALLHVLSTVSTGGFSSSPDSIRHFGGVGLHLAVTAFMCLGAIGFPAYYLLRRQGLRPFFREVQLKYLAGLLVGSWIVMWGAWNFRAAMILPSLFTSATSLTTTGFTTVAESSWPAPVVFVSILLMIIGGSSGSTAGGLKLYRLIVLLRTIRWYLLRALLPQESKIAIKIRDRAVEDDAIRQTVSLVSLYVILAAGSALAFIMYGFSTENAVFESVSAIGTVGLSSGVTSAALPSLLKVVLIVDMWLGRLEILPVLVVFYPVIWLPRRHQ
jgi:trk system potassium uptake protein TrkH